MSDIVINVTAPGAPQSASDMQRAADAARDLTDRQQAAALGAIQFGQRLAGAANAVQALTARLGDHSGTAGLIGAAMNTSVQFAQLGAMVGPGGALVGGIVGAAIPVLEHLSHAFDAIVVHAAASGQTVEQMVAHYTGMREAAALTQRLADGTATLDERWAEATRAQAVYDNQTTQTVQLQTHLAELQEEEQSRLSRILFGLTNAEATRRMEAEATEREIAASQQHAEALRAEAHELTETARQAQLYAAMVQSMADARASAAAEAERQRQLAIQNQEDLDAAAQQAQARAAADLSLSQQVLAAHQAQAAAREALLHHEAETEHAILVARVQAREQEEGRMYALSQERANAQAVYEKQLGDQQVAEQRRRNALVQHDVDEAKARAEASAQQNAQRNSQFFGTIISATTDVISEMQKGALTAAQAGEKFLASMLAAIAQYAAVKALESAALALMAASEERWDGFATGLAAAALWGAVAVATGVGSSALNADVSAHQAAAHQGGTGAAPAAPQHTSSGTTAGGPSVVNLYWNTPIMTQQQGAQAGREVRRILAQSSQQFPNG